jgi:hypothetical protein
MEIRLCKLKDIRAIQNYSAVGPCPHEVGLGKAADGEFIASRLQPGCNSWGIAGKELQAGLQRGRNA